MREMKGGEGARVGSKVCPNRFFILVAFGRGFSKRLPAQTIFLCRQGIGRMENAAGIGEKCSEYSAVARRLFEVAWK